MRMTAMNDDSIAELKAMVLNEHRPVLCKTLIPDRFFPYMRSKYILDQDDIDLINSGITRSSKVEKFIDTLISKGQRGFDELVTSIIEEKTQVFLASKLNKSFESKLKRLQALAEGSQRNLAPPVLHTPSSPIEHCNSPEPNCKAPVFDYKKLKDEAVDDAKLKGQAMKLKEAQEGRRLADCVSDLGVNTEELPKPVMPKNKVEQKYEIMQKTETNT